MLRLLLAIGALAWAGCVRAGFDTPKGNPDLATADWTSADLIDSTSVLDGPCEHGACGGLVPSNVDTSKLPSSCGDLSLNSSATIDTTTCTITPGGCVGVLQIQPIKACVVVVGSFNVSSGSSVAVSGANPLIIVAIGPVGVAGTIDAGGHGPKPGPGGGEGGVAVVQNKAQPGGGPGGGKFCTCTAGATDDCGGGGGGFGTAGGNGGLELDVSVGCSNPSSGGKPYGAGLNPLQGGSGDASGHESDGSHPTFPGAGGGGGGAIQISSQSSIDLGGAISVGGGGGGGGVGTTYSVGGGGGGSGGGVLLEAVTITGSGWVAASGGGGGGGGLKGNGGAGADGTIGTTQAAGGTVATANAGAGGAGAAGAKPAGAGADKTGAGGGGGGGGGGGLGRIHLRWAATSSKPKLDGSGVLTTATFTK